MGSGVPGRGITFDKERFFHDYTSIELALTDGSYRDSFSDITIAAREGTGHVWYDTYRDYDYDDGISQTIYGHLHPDVAEKIGLALIEAAKIARRNYDGS